MESELLAEIEDFDYYVRDKSFKKKNIIKPGLQPIRSVSLSNL